ncbi:MAG: Calx-beta domain-containing protein [Pseudomonadota bacterium]
MNTPARILTPFIATLLLGLAACGGGDEAAPAPAPPVPPPPSGTLIGAGGGTVSGPTGTTVVIPAGALATEARINIEQTTTGSPALPANVTFPGAMFAITPHGTTFTSPVTVTLPFNPALVPAGQTPALYKTNAQNTWEQVPGAVFGATTVTAQVTSFSYFDVGVEPFSFVSTTHAWEVFQLKGDALTEEKLVEDKQSGSELAEHYDTGLAYRAEPVVRIDGSVLVPSDDTSTAQFAASADGKEWAMGTEAPIGITGAPINTVGSRATFRQSQTFRKAQPDAKLAFFLVGTKLQTTDLNGILGRGCPRAHQVGLLCDMISAKISFRAHAFTVPASPFDDFDYFFKVGGSASLTGIAGSWDAKASTAGFSRQKLWNTEDFSFTIDSVDEHEEAIIVMKLAHPIFHTYTVDLSSIAVGQVFTLEFLAEAIAYNRAASSVNNRGPEFETSAGAYVGIVDEPSGILVNSEGLQSIDSPTPDAESPPDTPVEPASCPAPNSAAGTLQFSSASYQQSESNAIAPIVITRAGGSAGAVTVTFSTSDGSAAAGTDYNTVSETVFFGDGDSDPRTVNVSAIKNDTFNEPDKTVNLTLSEPGACATLGAQSTAVLTIQDDDTPPPPPAFTIGGTVTGLEGTGLVLRDLHFLPITPGNGPFTMPSPTTTGEPYELIVFTQPSNPVQICTVTNGSGIIANAPVTDIQVNCTTTPPPSGLDPTFGGIGKVSTDFGGDETDMLIQPDGKIIMIGGSGSDFVLARYNSNGTLDDEFGNGGLVTTDIAGGADAALAGALQGDKIIVVGYARVGGNDDFAVVRYNANGTPDTSFGTQGKVTTDFFGKRNGAYAVAIASDNQIIVAGEAQAASGIGADFALARYSANGVFDTTFGGVAAGKVVTDIVGGTDLGRNVVIDSSGKILVSGAITLANEPFLEHMGIARYDSNGVPDNSFDVDGKLSVLSRSLGEALAMQGDKILIAGSTPVSGKRQFGLMRLNTNGSVDSTFGSGGLTTTQFSTLGDFGRAIALQADGKILVSGQASNELQPDFALARYSANGAPDLTFDGDGKMTVDFFGKGDSAESVAVQADGRIVLGGFVSNITSLDYGLARIVP